jgi:hypothetical protein
MDPLGLKVNLWGLHLDNQTCTKILSRKDAFRCPWIRFSAVFSQQRCLKISVCHSWNNHQLPRETKKAKRVGTLGCFPTFWYSHWIIIDLRPDEQSYSILVCSWIQSDDQWWNEFARVPLRAFRHFVKHEFIVMKICKTMTHYEVEYPLRIFSCCRRTTVDGQMIAMPRINDNQWFL